MGATDRPAADRWRPLAQPGIECRARGCYKTSLSANLKREHAHAFYESLDFERHGYSFRVVHGDSR